MATEAMLSSGVKITVDSSDIDVKFTKSIEQLNKERTKSQRLLRLEYDAQGRLNDALGRCVEGLSLYQQKLGMWVDETGRARTLAGGFADDLSRTELELGYYADEMGNVRDRSGDFVRLTKDAANAQKEMASASQEAGKAFSDSYKSIADTFGRLSIVIAQLESSGASFGSFGSKILTFSQSLSTSAGVFQSVLDLEKGLKGAVKNSGALFSSLKNGAKSSTQVLGGLKGSVGALAPAFSMLTGPVGLAVAGVAALGAGIATAVAASSENNKLSDSFKEIEKSAKKAGDAVKTLGDALHYGAFQTPVSEYDAAFDKIQKTADALKKAQDEYDSTMRSVSSAGGMSGVGAGAGFMGEKELATAKAEQKNAWAEYADVVKQTIASAREEQRTEVDKLVEQKRIFESIRDQADKNEELKKDVEARKVVEKQIDALEKKIADAKSREADAAIAAARRDAGIDQYLTRPAQKVALTLDAYADAAKKWREDAEKLGLTQEQVDEALKRYKTAVDENVKNELARRLGVDFGSSSALSLNDKFKELDQAFADEKIAAEEHAAGLRQLQDARARELAESADRIRDEKSVAEVEKKRAEEIARVNAEFKNKRIAQKQRDELLAKVETESVATIKSLNDARREKAARELGVDFERGASGNAAEDYQKNLAKLNALLRDQIIKQDEYANGLAQLKENALASLPGVSELLAATKTAATAEEKHAQVVKSLDEALEKGMIDQARRDELLAKATERLAEERKREAESKRSQAVASIGLDAFIAAGEKEKSAREKIEEQFGKIRKALHEGLISQEQMNKATKSRTNQLKELRRQEKEAARQAAAQRRQDARSKLGIDSLMESLKTPLQKYRETMDEIASATKMGAISRAERAALENKAVDDYWNAMRDKQTREGADRRQKDELAKSMSSGSAELYLSQVKNQTANYQSRIQQTTENLYKTSQEALYQSQQTNYYLQEMLANSGAVGVWG